MLKKLMSCSYILLLILCFGCDPESSGSEYAYVVKDDGSGKDQGNGDTDEKTDDQNSEENDDSGDNTSAKEKVTISVTSSKFFDNHPREAEYNEMFLVVQVKIKNELDKKIPIGFENFTVTTADGLTLIPSSSTTNLRDYCNPSYSLEKGYEKECYLSFSVPLENKRVSIKKITYANVGLDVETESELNLSSGYLKLKWIIERKYKKDNNEYLLMTDDIDFYDIDKNRFENSLMSSLFGTLSNRRDVGEFLVDCIGGHEICLYHSSKFGVNGVNPKNYSESSEKDKEIFCTICNNGEFKTIFDY